MIGFQNIFRQSIINKIILYVLMGAVLLLIIFYIFRNTILHAVIEKKCALFKEKYNAELKIAESDFTGFTGITLEKISVVPKQGDTLLNCKKLYIHLKFFPMLFGKVHINEVLLENTEVALVSKQGKNNYDFLFRNETDTSNLPRDTTVNYSSRLDKFFSTVFSKIPDDFVVRNFFFRAFFDSNDFALALPAFEIENHKFLSAVGIEDSGIKSICFLKGEINKSKQLFYFMLYALPGEKVHLPYVKQKLGLLLNFDRLSVGISAKGNSSLIDIKGSAMISGLLVNHKKIAETDVFFELLGVNFNIRAKEHSIELDSSSAIIYNRFVLNPYVSLRQSPKFQIRLKINNEFAAQDLFESLPSGMFQNFMGFKTKGKLTLFVNFELDMQQPDSLKFDAALTGKDFAIIKYGGTDFRKINGTFSHTAYVNGIPVRTFDVGPENPAFTPLEAISPYLKDAVLISENGGFYYSDGFNVDAFRESIITNIHAGRFVRGGSTIDMQLVKNVFLSKNKTIARKVEEILITWLINYNHLCSKEKMYEVYLNLIEWGPGVYGISEASDYYFKKKPYQLNLPESIFLASIIPRPRWFKSSFESDGKLSVKNQRYFSLIAGKLILKGSAATADTVDMLKKVELKGAAKIFMAKDTVRFKIDSVWIRED